MLQIQEAQCHSMSKKHKSRHIIVACKISPCQQSQVLNDRRNVSDLNNASERSTFMIDIMWIVKQKYKKLNYIESTERSTVIVP